MDDGTGSLTPTYTEVDPATVNNKPSLRSHPITFTALDTSKTYRFYMVAWNSIG